MPVFNFFHWTQEKGEHLEESGPIIPVTISVPAAMQDFLVKNGKDIPPPVTGMALIDTGAFATAVDCEVFSLLGVTPIDKITTSTPHGAGKSDVYPASITFPMLGLEDLQMERVIGCQLQWPGEKDSDVLMLLGRDMLKHFLMVYNGKHSDVTLGF
jgi:hypothetical protein